MLEETSLRIISTALKSTERYTDDEDIPEDESLPDKEVAELTARYKATLDVISTARKGDIVPFSVSKSSVTDDSRPAIKASEGVRGKYDITIKACEEGDSEEMDPAKVRRRKKMRARQRIERAGAVLNRTIKINNIARLLFAVGIMMFLVLVFLVLMGIGVQTIGPAEYMLTYGGLAFVSQIRDMLQLAIVALSFQFRPLD